MTAAKQHNSIPNEIIKNGKNIIEKHQVMLIFDDENDRQF